MRKETRELGIKLVNAGFKIVPIKVGEKDPRTKGWPKIRASLKDVQRWGKSSYYGGWGVLGEFSPGIDIDVSDIEITKKLLKWCNIHIGKSIVRLGEKPRILIPCRPPNNKTLGSDASNKYTSPDGKTHQIEIKASGRQWVAYGNHKETKLPYTWPLGELFNTSPEELPVLNGEKIAALYEYFYSLLPIQWTLIWQRRLKKHGFVNYAGEIIGAVNFENYKPPLDIPVDKIKSMLSRIDPDEHINGLGWRTVGMALYHQFEGSQEGKDIFIEWSKSSVDFNIEEIEARWPSWGAASYSGNPITAATLVKLYQCKIENSEDPTLKKKSNKLSDWESRFALVELSDGTEVHDMGAPIWRAKRRTLAAFKEHNSAYIQVSQDPNGNKKIIPMVDAWRASLNTRHYAGYTYQPGEKRYCRAEFNFGDPSLYVNTFYFPPHEEVEQSEIDERIKIFLIFLAHLFPNRDEKEWILMWLARMIQRPDTRSFVTPINITPVTGTGRGIFFEILRRLIGGHNCHDVSKDDLEGKFNNFLATCIVAVIQEIKSSTGEKKYQMWERMKDILADQTGNIRAMHQNSYTATIRANFLMFSNHINALPIEDVNERRIYATRGASAPISPKHTDQIINWMQDEKNIAALFCHFKNYPVNHDRFKRATVTETKRQMVIASAGESKVDVHAWLKTEAPLVFDFDYALEKLFAYSQDIAERGYSRQAFRQCLHDIGWQSSRVTINNRRMYLYYDPNKIKNDKRVLRLHYLKLDQKQKE